MTAATNPTTLSFYFHIGQKMNRDRERLYGIWVKNVGEGWHAEDCSPDATALIAKAAERMKEPDVESAVIRPLGQMPWT